MKWFNKLLIICVCVALISGISFGQAIPQFRPVGYTKTGTPLFLSIDSTGALSPAGSGTAQSPASGYIPSVALQGLGTDGLFHYLALDSTGAVVTTAATVNALGLLPLADYNFTTGSGTTLADMSGNGNNATFATTAPTWIQGGLAFTGQQNVPLPSALNSAKTIVLGVYINPITTTTGNANAYPLVLSSSLGTAGINVLVNHLNGIGTSSFSLNIYNNGYTTEALNLVSGFHVFTLVLGTGSGNLDHFYIDSNEVDYSIQGSSAGAQTSGNLILGSAGQGPFSASGLEGAYYRAIFYNAQLTPTQVQAVNGLVFADVAKRGVATSPVAQIKFSNTFGFIGDSITFGFTLSNPATQAWPANLSLVNTPYTNSINYGITGIALEAITGSEPNRFFPFCKAQSGQSLLSIFAGTNDAANFSYATPASVFKLLAGYVQAAQQAGCKVYVGTMISRTGNAASGGTMDAFKNAYDTLIVANANAYGYGVFDFASNALLGADNAYSNPTYFAVDNTHPTAAGQLLLAAMASNVLNHDYGGYSISTPHIVTSLTYAMTNADTATTIGTVGAGTIAFTAPSCLGVSGLSYSINNPQATDTMTIVGQASQPINGLATGITIPSNSTVTLKAVANSRATSGCHWVL